LCPHAHFKFLHQELLYSNSIPVCSITSSAMYPTDTVTLLHTVLHRKGITLFQEGMQAQITNILIHFIGVIYIPKRGLSLALHTWIVVLLEVLRRCQWNVCTSILVLFTLFSCLAFRGNVRTGQTMSNLATWTSVASRGRYAVFLDGFGGMCSSLVCMLSIFFEEWNR
jgi:hypothetical protein